MLHYLAINGLLGYILREKLKPSSSNEPQAYDNWVENDCFTYTAITMNILNDDEAEIDMGKGAKVAWGTLKERHFSHLLTTDY
jgi:hypothetical protein